MSRWAPRISRRLRPSTTKSPPKWASDASSNRILLSPGVRWMVALAARDRAEVDRIYHLALSLGGTDEGPPGPRGDQGFYAAYFRDLDGNKLNAFVMG